jgi:hypothetical protein
VLVTLGRDRQNALTLQRVGRLFVRDESEERAQSGEASVASVRGIGTRGFQVTEKGAKHCRVEIFHAKLRRLLLKALRGEDEQKSERVAVRRDGV